MSTEQPSHQDVNELDPIVLDLTRFQAGEVEHGLDIDADDHPDDPGWGEVNETAKGFRLVIQGTQEARDRALYRITSARDILLDNAADRMGNARERRQDTAQGRSMTVLTGKLIEAAGGPEAFSPDARRWIAR